MSSEIKYTTDGKKVVVIGDLNQTEKIVQEIFVTEDGCEIPQGERFVCKNLLDVPVKSWKEKELNKLEKIYEAEKTEWESKIERLRNEQYRTYESLNARVKWLKDVAKQPFEDKIKDILNTLSIFLSDKPKYFVIKNRIYDFNEEGYNNYLDDFDDYYHANKYEGMKLITLYGNSKGDFQWYVHRYGDGSGSSDKIKFFDKYEDAILALADNINSQSSISLNDIDISKKYGFKIKKELLIAFQENKLKGYNETIKDLETKLIELKKAKENFEKNECTN